LIDLERRIVQAADIVTVALDELLPRAEGPESRLTEAMRYAALGPGKRRRTLVHWLIALGLFLGFLGLAASLGLLQFIPRPRP